MHVPFLPDSRKSDAYGISWEWEPVDVPSDFHTSMTRALLRHTPMGARILEIGVGSGYLLSCLNLQASCRCVGLDRLAEALEVSMETARRVGATISVVHGDAFALPFGHSTFDVVTSLGVIEHFPQASARALLGEHARVCREGGRVIVSVPNGLDFWHSLFRWSQGKAYRFHPERSYTPWALSRELRHVGLQPVAQDGYAPLWSLRQHRLGYPITALLYKAGLLGSLDRLATPRVLSWIGNLTMQVAVKPHHGPAQAAEQEGGGYTEK